VIRAAAIILMVATIVPVVPQEERFSKNIVVIVDVSGSMNTSVEEAVSSFRMVSEQPVDEMNLAVVAFANNIAFWDWHKLPDEQAVADAEAWLAEARSTLGSDTHPILAFERALRLSKEELTVVLVSDGEFWHPSADEIIEAIRRLQKERKANRRKAAVICCIGVDQREKESLSKIAKLGKGGYFKWVKN
jgi:Mg-chelatase subunit ChlD